jgi:hypothetical protein
MMADFARRRAREGGTSGAADNDPALLDQAPATVTKDF